MGELQLIPQVFSILSSLIEERGGLHYGLKDLGLMASKVSPRARALGFDLLLDYYYFIRYDPQGDEELAGLLESLVIHETYFFREAEQLKLLVDTCLLPRVEAGARPRVWCAAASTGEEPYTLAMLLGERKLLGHVELIASDLSRSLLARAQAGIYGGRALRAVEGTVATRWLVPTGAREVRVPQVLRRAIDWRRINLVDRAPIEALGKFDAILCRNVLIYFSDSVAARVVRQLTSALKTRGLLLVGASESLMPFGTGLNCEERSGSFFYRKSN